MTDVRRPRHGPHPGWTLGGALALFAAVLTLLVWQVRTGHDPALGAPRPALVAQAPPQRVLVKRIVRRVIDEKVVEHDDDDGGIVLAPAAPAVSSTPVVSGYSAPAPAPAPAPIVTRSS